MRSLDQFYRYIEQREGAQEKPAEESSATAAAAATAAATEVPVRSGAPVRRAKALRYVLRNGVTIPLPAEDSAPAAAPAHDEAAAVLRELLPADDVRPPESLPDASGAGAPDAASAPAVGRPDAPVGEEDAADAASWRALPEAVRALARLAEDGEGAQGERRQLIERLLNPLLTLEDAARLLGVHPGTVRRWANKGVLPHQRTVGQQRRFRLTDVLACRDRREQEAEGATGGAEPAAA